MIIKTSSAFFFFFSTHVILKNCQVVALFEFFFNQHCPNGIRKERDKVKSVFCSQKEVVLAVIYSILPDLLLKYPNLFLGYRTKTWKYMKNDKLKLNASCIPKAVISRDWQRLPTHPQLVQIMWFLCSIHLFYYYYEEWTSFKGCCIGIVWVEDNNRFSHIRTAELYNECVIAKLRLPQHHINITISYFLNNICVLIILCVYNKCKNKTEFAPTEKHQLFMWCDCEYGL